MMSKFVRAANSSLAVALVIVLGGCEDAVSVGANGEATLSFMTARSAASFGLGVQSDPIQVGSHTVDLTRAELHVSEIELESEADSIEIEVRRRTTVVALPVSGSTNIVTPITAPVLPGSYDELKLKIRTVRVVGTFDGQPFDVSVRINEELEQELEPPLVVTETGAANVTVTIDVATWFRNRDGSAIDPRNLTPAAQERLRENIKASLQAFEDDDCDGERGHREGHRGRDRS
jgi:hypothetical protein